MGIDIFSDNRIPLALCLVGIIIILSDFIKLTSTRKVTLKHRTKTKRGLIVRVVTSYLITLLNKNEGYNILLDKIQFDLGYFSANSEVKNKKNAESMIIKTILVNMIILIGIMLFKTLFIAKVLVMAGILLFEYLYLKSSINRRKQKLRDQFPILVREFIEGYALTNNVKLAFEYTTKEISPVFQVHVNRLINQLSSSSTIDDAFKYFANRIGYSMCNTFVSIVQSAYSTKRNIIDNLIEFQEMLNEDRVSDKATRTKLASYSNNIMLWIVACVAEIFIVGAFIKTSTGNYFFTTATGQNLLITTIVCIVLAIICIRVSESI